MIQFANHLNDPFVFALTCAIIGYVYTNPLTEPGHILSGWYKMWSKLLEPKLDFIFKPLVGCERCFTGQWALIVWYLIHRKEYREASGFDQWAVLILVHIFVVLLSIIMVIITSYIIQLLKKYSK